VLEAFESAPALKQSTELQPYWLGALVLTGDLAKAEALFKKARPQGKALAASRFFLALGLVRQSRYSEARKWIAENLRGRHQRRDFESQFYIFQGLAFYRFFSGRFYLAKKYASLAYEAAVEAELPFGEMIAKDLLAHSLVQTGQVHKGLAYFEDTLKTATRAKNEWLSAAIQISLVKFRAQFGLDPHRDLVELETALASLAPQDTYSIAELLLEMIRQYILRGQFTRAERHLSRAADIIYKHQNRRQMATLNLRMSYMLYLQGQYTQSLHVIRFSDQNIDKDVDLNLWTQMTGLKALVIKNTGAVQEAQELRALLARETVRTTAMNRRILARATAEKTAPLNAMGEDPIGDLLDKARRQDPSAPRLITESGYYGLLHKYYRVPFGTQCLIFDLVPGSVVILDRGNVTFKKKGLNSLLRKIIVLLRGRAQSKEDLVRQIWGYEYDPLRHDALIYSSINKVRKLLEPYGDWISLSEEGYSIRKDIKVIIKNVLKVSDKIPGVKTPQLSESPPAATKNARALPAAFKDLNFRQLQIIDYLKKNTSISILELSTKLAISKPTATRDLSQLHKLGILKRVGKGRATRYLI